MIKIQYTDPKLVSPQPGHVRPSWNLQGASLELRSQREGRAVRGGYLGQLCNQLLCNQLQCLPWELGGGGGVGGGQTMGVLWGTRIGQFFFSIRKQHSVDKVHTL